MIELFQITGSASFAARAALEEAGADYTVVDVHPRRRDEAPGFAEANPLKRVPTLRDGDATIHETGAVLLWIADRFPDLGAPLGSPERGELYRWVTWTANTLHPAWWPLMLPGRLTTDPDGAPGVRERGVAAMARHGAYLEERLVDRQWCLGERFSVADLYLYMLVGWQSYVDDVVVGGDAVQGHYARVGARPATTRARALDDLDERLLRFDPSKRGGQPL